MPLKVGEFFLFFYPLLSLHCLPLFWETTFWIPRIYRKKQENFVQLLMKLHDYISIQICFKSCLDGVIQDIRNCKTFSFSCHPIEKLPRTYITRSGSQSRHFYLLPACTILPVEPMHLMFSKFLVWNLNKLIIL